MNVRTAVSSLLFAFVAVGAACSSSMTTPTEQVNCTPGAYVYCRCKNRGEGTKLCKEDGHSFESCDSCESPTNPVDPDASPPPDGGPDVTQPSACGDGVVQDGEDCDDGNPTSDDGCDTGCHLAGANPAASRSCPGLDVHVWSKAVTYAGSTVGSANTATALPTCSGTSGGNPTTGAAATDRIFHVIAHRAGTMTVATTETSYDAFLYVTAACNPDAAGNVTYLACMNGVNGPGDEALEFRVVAGESYGVVVDGAGLTQQQGSFRVTFSIR